MTEDAPNAPCPIFFKTHCPNMKKGCQFHHQTEICAQGRACEVQDCQLRHPPQCLLYARGWCGFIDSQKIPRRYRSCSYFHNGNVPQIPPTSTLSPQREGDINNGVTKQNTRREEGVENVLLVQPHPVTHLPTVQLSGDSNMNELKEELGQANAKISKLEQSIKQMQDALEKQAKIISYIRDTEIEDIYVAIGSRHKALEMSISDVENSVDKQFAEITQRIDNLQGDKNTVLVTGDNKLVEKNDNTHTLLHLLGHLAKDPSPFGTDSLIGVIHSFQFIREASKKLLHNRFPPYEHETDCQFCSLIW